MLREKFVSKLGFESQIIRIPWNTCHFFFFCMTENIPLKWYVCCLPSWIETFLFLLSFLLLSSFPCALIHKLLLQIDLMEDPEDPHGYVGRPTSQPTAVTVYTTSRPSTSRHSSAQGLVALQAMTPTIKSQIDSSLLELFYMDFQPLSIVQDKGFCRFVSSLNPLYQMPSRSVISKEMIPSLYDECLTAVRHKLNELQTCLSI